jgi:hypothetical protein
MYCNTLLLDSSTIIIIIIIASIDFDNIYIGNVF